MAENDAASRVAVFKRTSDMLTGIINEDRNHLSLVQRHGWQGTEEGRTPETFAMSRRISLQPEVVSKCCVNFTANILFSI